MIKPEVFCFFIFIFTVWGGGGSKLDRQWGFFFSSLMFSPSLSLKALPCSLSFEFLSELGLVEPEYQKLPVAPAWREVSHLLVRKPF